MNIRNHLCNFNLNDSQKNAILDCLSTRQRYEKNSIKLIWGPPGTGKTKTIGTLLLVLLMKKCKTLSCAPTNTAIVEVASRLLKLVIESSSGNSCCLGDVILFGNKKRMKVGDDLREIFLDDRVERLLKCFMPLTGWRHCLISMMDFLENADTQYEMYLKREDEEGEFLIKLTLKEFAIKNFFSLSKKLNFCLRTLSDDLPTASVSVENFKNMNQLLELINITGSLLESKDTTEKMLEEVLRITKEEDGDMHLSMELLHVKGDTTPKIKFQRTRNFCIQILRTLSQNLNLPNISDKRSIQDFCLQGAILIFCTASSSFRLHTVEVEKKLEFLVVDEAAQLKECESLISLQLPGIRHAIFIGDEHQLPAMVKSKVCICMDVIFICLSIM